MSGAAVRLFDDPSATSAGVNVASVPQRSPFRYPGGKTWFVPSLRKWLSTLPERPRLYSEPFVGGGILACTVLAENLADRVEMVELDEDVVSVWQTIFSDQAPALAKLVLNFQMQEDHVLTVLHQTPQTTTERAFQTIVRNRVNRGGILAPGAGRLKAGENGRGLLSRWYPETLARRVMNLTVHQHRVNIVHGDGITALHRHTQGRYTASLIDPPYTAGGKRAGSRLYRHWELDHGALFAAVSALQGSFLMTYDQAPEVQILAESYGLKSRAIAMKNTHHAELSELVIGRDVHWL